MAQLDPSEWEYVAEGSRNIVVAYRGENPVLQGHVLRLAKVSGDRHEPQQSPAAELIGDEYVLRQTPLLLSSDFLAAVAQRVQVSRPQYRLKTGLDLTRLEAKLLPDLTTLRCECECGCERDNWFGKRSRFPSVSVEIKPKCGFLPTSPHISEANAAKLHTCRFCMHQHEKRHKGEVDELSLYCPLDLFCTQRECRLRALHALFRTPQNNLRVFVDGELVFPLRRDAAELEHDPAHGDASAHNHASPAHPQHSSSGGGGDESLGAGASAAAAALPAPTDPRAVVGAHRSVLRRKHLHRKCAPALGVSEEACEETLARLVVGVLEREAVLERVLTVQRLDTLDVEGVFYLYCRLENLPCPYVPRDNAALDALSDAEARAAVRQFLIAHSAKDCSLMLSMQRVDELPYPCAHRVLHDAPLDARFLYRIAAVDLDEKREAMLPRYWELDHRIVSRFRVSDAVPCRMHRHERGTDSPDDEMGHVSR